jgi:5-methylcytosine-specific restriction enzyme A
VSRSTDEWIGKTDDSAIPLRVKERVARAAHDLCVKCDRKVGAKLRPEFDHVTPLILGGQNRESNIQLLCHECHGAKTKLDVKLKAKVARVHTKLSLGIRANKGRPMPGSRASGLRKRMDGTVERR